MDLIAALDAQLGQLQANGLQRVLRSVSSPCGAQIQVDGAPLLAFASNDYLGLAAHPLLVQALQLGAAQYGVGSGASHLISGHYAVHGVLEQRFAAMLDAHIPACRALLFGTGYMANLAVLTALAASVPAGECEIFSEQLNHASLIDGVRLSCASSSQTGARHRSQVFPHADVLELEHMLQACTASLKIVVTDGVFSMDGDIAPLAAMLALCERYGAWLMVDDAHGFGVLGADGHGVLQRLALSSSKLIYVGTLGKAAGVSGAFVAAHAVLIEWLIQRARPYIFST
ncbi:MAG: 8-amino-7-oxononanoate synthase, partial [Pseudomonadota bacterium]